MHELPVSERPDYVFRFWPFLYKFDRQHNSPKRCPPSSCFDAFLCSLTSYSSTAVDVLYGTFPTPSYHGRLKFFVFDWGPGRGTRWSFYSILLSLGVSVDTNDTSRRNINREETPNAIRRETSGRWSSSKLPRRKWEEINLGEINKPTGPSNMRVELFRLYST